MSEDLEILVVSVPTTDAEIASDLLWSAGAQAVEEVLLDDRVELLTELGRDPLDAWYAVVNAAFETTPSTWSASARPVDRAVADTWKQFATATVVGSMRIVPAWEVERRTRTGAWNEVLIDPGGSFGMGDHPTTRATLLLALDLAERGQNCASVLDLGCGSGVLGIALALRYGSRVVAADIAPVAIEATIANASLNGVADRFVVEHGDIRMIKGTYDLVLANILAPVLLADRDEILRRVTSRGTVILSGFTETRLNDIITSYEAAGCRRRAIREVEGWYGLELECP
jgi:ribosomal protein L11 methyltransferase